MITYPRLTVEEARAIAKRAIAAGLLTPPVNPVTYLDVRREEMRLANRRYRDRQRKLKARN